MRQKMAEKKNFNVELINYSKEGKTYWIALEIQPIFNEEKVLTHWIAIGSDITIQRLTQEHLRSAKKKAEEAREAMNELLSRMSHELRTALNGILGFGQVLKLAELQPRQYLHVDRILKAGNHLLELINEMLDISKLEAGAMQLDLGPVAINSILQEVIDLVQMECDKRDILITTDQALAFETSIVADKQRLKQVLINLVSNAVKYNVDGGQINKRCVATWNDHWRIELLDQGLGISEDSRDKLFSPFERLSAENTTIEGTGLGLALTKKLTEAMRGRIGYHPNYPKGSVFWVEFESISSGNYDQLSYEVQSSDETDSKKTYSQGTILYIEDNPDNLLLVENVLHYRPKVKLLNTPLGKVGLEMARNEQPQLILLDLNLPDCHGKDILVNL